MKLTVTILFLFNLSAIAQIDTLRFFNDDYMVIESGMIIFRLDSKGGGRLIDDRTKTPKDAFAIVEESAEFPGGRASLDQYIIQNLRTPNRLLESKATGFVDVLFTVAKNGDIKNVLAVGDTTFGRGIEAKRLIEEMPKWKPAAQRSRVVSTRLSIRINFDY